MSTITILTMAAGMVWTLICVHAHRTAARKEGKIITAIDFTADRRGEAAIRRAILRKIIARLIHEKIITSPKL